MKDLKIFTEDIEDEALKQINTLMEQPAFADCKIRIMPDVHAGAGCVIGFTANLGDKVIPNIVGVDIGCGMRVVPLGKINIDYEKLDQTIREYVPSGLNVHEGNILEDNFFTRLVCYDRLSNIDWLKKSCSTLGGGNHFIEIDENEEGCKFLVIHTGSRNLGKQVADIYQKIAIKKCHSNAEERNELINKLKSEGREREISKALEDFKKECPRIPDELCYLEGEDRENYLHDMRLCQDFAVLNRELISITICIRMGWFETIADCVHNGWESVHNYIDKNNMVRKGAISAKVGEQVIIPINMRDGCIVGVGKGNPIWNYSAPHGAGRIMSRKKAKETIDISDFKDSMKGIYTTSVNLETIDEAPMAYKPMQEIIDNIKDTVNITDIIKPVYNFKASE